LRKKSLIDDLSLGEEFPKGPPILFTNPEIRRMLHLAHVGRSDVFFDLGSGWGQNLILALAEAGVKEAIGIEKDKGRSRISIERLDKWAKNRLELAGRYKVVQGDFEDLFNRKLEGADLRNATVVFYGLTTYLEVVSGIRRNWKGLKSKRLVYYYPCLFPEIMPDRSDYPFLVSDFPFKKPRSELDWLRMVVGKTTSSIGDGPPAASELWDELRHDYDVDGDKTEISYYRTGLKEITGNVR